MHALFLFAQTNRRDDLAGRMAESFRGEGVPFDSKGMAYAVAGLSVLVLVAWFLAHTAEREEKRGRCSPKRLFLSLCRANRLAWSDRWFLWRLAARHRLEDPARVFIEPDRFDPAEANLQSQRYLTHLKRLRARLFAEIMGDRPANSSPSRSRSSAQ
jgi:hypothetical protein